MLSRFDVIEILVEDCRRVAKPLWPVGEKRSLVEYRRACFLSYAGSEEPMDSESEDKTRVGLPRV